MDRYGKVARALHWIMAILILFNLFLGFAHDALPRDWKVMPVHKSIGLTVLALAVARILWRFTRRAPALPAGMPAWERGAAHATRSEEHTSALQSLMRISYAVFCLKKKTTQTHYHKHPKFTL